ncbi:MAG: Hsp20/alpha crystallin family protein [Flintibacter sp.]|uniref:Hsp20/alpha crystallin family protein n=1 Tax=Flintibacter TaxID=1918454 RepID=UPI001F439BBA|nr:MULTISPECIES: Hsp20/alpha crystallin family protein [Eubacteriales]MDY5037591.1 Hsp20/alpha crystallin family protein [Lawsonibacter sp.]MCF2676307.1 Hsp20/alpha crystallin family protein [Pseudoflavonifractor phocaeensis]MCI6151420.1 Hsp20/alpha crystallin family protein [Flintibacter sp.]MCI7158727.1 Hsp20/alpha crystallin family protein [Flintibacter sp.]MCI7659427.1 Hsp20/alpha crystallin family protein [Flintibacter sp.]
MLPSLFGESLFDRFFDDSLEKEFFGTHNPLYGKHAKNLMKTDVKDVNDHYEVAVDLPGFQKDEVNVELENGYLTISAAKGLDKDQKDDEGHYIRQERYSGSCSRSFYVGDIQPEDIHAKYEDGILKLTLPKADQKAMEHQNRIAIQ